ncbi:snRNA-activating protein complex subunit 3-like [Xenia sp. Carnegie-2017]|uniref:snRNA-activating protein complex subunit 3-like n=1 Tax=Xenia sp. Carnegie-2017 TaxID=2897299 RepID=UPI001F044025|nr:snRNA-activating protein complex subunit 3-like [Xenia sp. Carnegie-2017]
MATYKCSSLINVKEFKENVLSTVCLDEIQNTRDKKRMLKELDLGQETLTELSEVCSPINLKRSPKGSPTLDVEHKRKEELSSATELASLRLLPYNDKMTSYKMFLPKNYLVYSEELKNVKPGGNDLSCQPEVVLSVALFHPVSCRKVQEFLVLGRQKLTELRDKIYCPADTIVVGEHSENPEFAAAASNKDVCPSAFIFIEGVFYNDMRKDLCRDYSTLIMDWIKSHKNEEARYGVCTSKKMEESSFEDLSIKLGYPYVYMHQGNCEHLLIFRDLRMLHADDPQSTSFYPFQIFRPRPMRRTCMVCAVNCARWLTRYDLLMSEDPSLFCEKCFKALHYKGNDKAYPFSAYQYCGVYYW